jgi:precorrin-6Y C5,15-methyltransferase (decarboxylating)
MSPADPLLSESAAPRRWLSIVGIGEDGVDGLSPAARQLVSQADIVFGGARHLKLADPLIRGARQPWPSPFDRAVAEVLAHRTRQVCVLASGDPFWHGVGSTLARDIDPSEMLVVPAPSAFSLAAARLGWPLPAVTQLSLHGQALDLIRPHLHPGARIFALTSDGSGPAKLAALLRDLGFGASRMIVLEALGGSHERIHSTRVADFNAEANPLNVVALELAADKGARVLAVVTGLPDDLFEHDGQITKREIRAITLSSLAPRQGELLWDVGAGAGSVAIEWLLAHSSMRAIAIERHTDRAAAIARNASAFGVPRLEVIPGGAPFALDGLETPDAVFVGGGASAAVLDLVMRALRPGGRLVVNAVTLETEAELLQRHSTAGGELLRITLSRADAVGAKHGWRPAMPVTQWTWVKP